MANVTVKFPRHYKNWDVIIKQIESFYKAMDMVAFVVPADVDDFVVDPPVEEDVYQQMIDSLIN